MARRLHTTVAFCRSKEEAEAFMKTIKPWRRGAITEWESNDTHEVFWLAWYKY